MIYVFAGLIVAFAASSIWYLYENSFATETLEIVFPAIGAILLSGYLGYKSVLLDNPPPKAFNVGVAVLYDQENGVIRGMAPSEAFGEFRGARIIDILPYDPDFRDLRLSERLRDTSGDLSSSRTTTVIENILEYSVLEWLSFSRFAGRFWARIRHETDHWRRRCCTHSTGLGWS